MTTDPSQQGLGAGAPPPPPDATPPAAAAIPATFSNQFYLSVIGGELRITFGEIVYGVASPQWRTAVVMPSDVALYLSNVIQDLFKRLYVPPAAPEAQSPPPQDGH